MHIDGEDDDILELEGFEDETDPVDPDDDDQRNPDDDEEPQDDGLAVLRQQRAHIRKLERELRDAKKPTATEIVAAGPRPSYGDGSAYDFSDAKYEAALDEWDAKREAEIVARAKADTAKPDPAVSVRPHVDAYYASADKLTAPDAQDVLADMESALSPAQQMAVVLAAGQASPNDPAALVYSIARDPDTLDRLAGIENPIMLATEIAKMAAAPSRPKPAIDKAVRGGRAAPSGAKAGQAQLDKAKAAAEASGDYTAYFALKRRMAARTSA